MKPTLLIVIGCCIFGCSKQEGAGSKQSAPVAAMEEKILSVHGHERIDEYYWIRDDTRKSARVISLLHEENAYTREMMAHTSDLQVSLFEEMSSRLPVTDKTVPIRRGDYAYFQEYRRGGEYPIYKRTFGELEQLLLDANELSKGHQYYEIGNFSVSPDHRLLALAEDTVSRGEYRLRIKNIAAGDYLPDEVSRISPALAWAADNQSLFYVKKDPQTLLPNRVYQHRLGSTSDELVFEETDPAFFVNVRTTRSQKYVLISASSAGSTEIRVLDARGTKSEPVVFLPREKNHEYRIRHVEGWFYILTNWQASNFRLMRVPEDRIGSRQHWHEVIAHQDDVLLEDFEIFDDYVVVAQRQQGLTNIQIFQTADGTEKQITFADPTYTARLHANPESGSSKLRYSYTSLTTPPRVYEYDMAGGGTTLLKTSRIMGDFNSSDYHSKRFFFTARDGTKVPVSLVYRRDRFSRGKNPGYVYACGSYGHSSPASFQAQRLSLLDRGFVVAIIHVRGGDEMGRHWYEDGRLLRKKIRLTTLSMGLRRSSVVGTSALRTCLPLADLPVVC